MIVLKCVCAMRDADREKLREKITEEVGQEVAILPGGVELATAQKLLFLCDRKACAKCCYPQCKHTQDLEHARNFAPDRGFGAGRNCAGRRRTEKETYDERDTSVVRTRGNK